MIRYLLAMAAALALSAPPAYATQPNAASADLWRRDGGRISFTTARFSFPTELGSLRLTQAAEFSQQGRGIDSGLQYQSADGEVFATVYVYYPGLAHAGLTAFMTGDAITGQSGNVRVLGNRTVAAGGHADAAIRIDYAGYRNNLASSAAFIKAGRWIVKLRVSGPEARRAEVETAMAALLDRMRFDGEIRPRAAAPIEIGECEAVPAAAGRARRNDPAEILQATIMATLDGAGEEPRNARTRSEVLLSRVGARWCAPTRLRIGESAYPVLRSRRGGPREGLSRTALIVFMTDAGRMLELVEAEGRYTLLHHNVGRTDILGSYDGPLTDAQLADILSGADRSGGQVQATIELQANGDTRLTVPTPEEGRRPQPVT